MRGRVTPCDYIKVIELPPVSPAAAPKQIVLPAVHRTALFLLCSVDAAWVPGARLQLLSQPSLKCENLSLKAQEWNFLWSFPKTATDYRIMTATGLFCYTLT